MINKLLVFFIKACYITLMFSARKCIEENCDDYAVTGSRYCFSHINDPSAFMKDTVSMLSDCDNIANFKFCKAAVTDIRIPCRTMITSKFSETVFRNTVFDDISIKLCFFDFCEFYNCSFTSTDIRYSVFAGSVFIDCNFKDSEILHTNFNGSRIRQSFFQSCDLYYSSFVMSGLQDAGFQDCNLKKVNYTGATRSNVSFKYSNHEEAEFDKGQAP